MKTHVVIDLESQEGQEGIWCGTQEECNDYVASQSDYFMYKVVHMTPEEIEFENAKPVTYGKED